MDYVLQQRSPAKHVIGITIVLILHLLFGYSLVNGMARRLVDATRAIMETKIIAEEEKVRDDTPSPPSPKLVKLTPVFVPPPEVHISAPAAIIPTISNVIRVPPPVKKSAPRPVIARPAPVHVGVACPNSQGIRASITYPTRARRDGLEGNVLIEFTVSADGSVKDVHIKHSTDRIFNAVSVNAVKQFKCNAQGRDVNVTVPFSYRLVD